MPLRHPDVIHPMDRRVPVLLVEDDDDVLDAISELLRDDGYSVVTARSGFEALTLLNQRPAPAAMVVDFMMAGMNGADFLKTCAADPRLASIPAVVISAGRPADLAAEGIHNFVPKPFRPERLLTALADMLPGHQPSMSAHYG